MTEWQRAQAARDEILRTADPSLRVYLTVEKGWDFNNREGWRSAILLTKPGFQEGRSVIWQSRVAAAAHAGDTTNWRLEVLREARRKLRDLRPELRLRPGPVRNNWTGYNPEEEQECQPKQSK